MHLYRRFLLFTLIVSSLATSSVNAEPSANENLKNIAHNVIANTSFNLPEKTTTIPQPGRYNAWMYQNFMLIEGIDSLYEITLDEQYRNYSRRVIDYFAAHQSKYGDSMTATPSGRLKWYSQPRDMWQCGMIASYASRAKERPDAEFDKGMAIFDKLLAKTPQLKDGSLGRAKMGSVCLQIDDLYMIAPYWCRKSILTGEAKWLDRAINETLSYHHTLWDEKHKLMRCLWIEKTQQPYGLFWGRGNGWYLMALTEVLRYTPEDHPKRKQLLSNYQTFIDGIIARQNKNGLWHQLLERPSSFTETSCSGMFTYCILKGVNQGWLDKSYSKPGALGWKGLQLKVNAKNQLIDVCPPTDMSEDPKYYLKGRQIIHDQHGLGPYILAGAEYLKMSSPDNS